LVKILVNGGFELAFSIKAHRFLTHDKKRQPILGLARVAGNYKGTDKNSQFLSVPAVTAL
jgi:hypothetical protein